MTRSMASRTAADKNKGRLPATGLKQWLARKRLTATMSLHEPTP
jgi:hypothetical protein